MLDQHFVRLGAYARIEQWLVLVCLAGLAAITLSGQGSYKPFVYLTELLVLVHLACWLWWGRVVRRTVVWLAVTPVAFIACDVIAADSSNKHAVQNLLAFLALAAAARMLPVSWDVGRRTHAAILAVFASVALAHAATLWLYLEPVGPVQNPGLLSHNPHFIALQAAAVVPVMVHGWFQGGAARWIAAVGIVAALACLVLLDSLMGLAALGAAALAVAAVYVSRRLRWGLMAAGGGALAWLLVYPVVPELFDDVLSWLRDSIGATRLDERFQIWTDSWQLQRQSSLREWLFGHGLGGYESDYPEIWVFPHHFGLEVLYNSGIVGLAVFLTATAALIVQLSSYVGRKRPELLLSVGLLVSVGVFTFLTLPLTSRVTTHALGLVVGFSLWALKRERERTGAAKREIGHASVPGEGR